MDLQIFQIPEMSFQTPSGWESFEGEGGPVAAGELRPGCQIWGLLCRHRRQLLGPLFTSLQLDCAPLLRILEPEAAGGSPVPTGAPAAPIGAFCMPGLCFVSGLCGLCGSAHQRHWAAIFPCFPRWGVQ